MQQPHATHQCPVYKNFFLKCWSTNLWFCTPFYYYGLLFESPFAFQCFLSSVLGPLVISLLFLTNTLGCFRGRDTFLLCVSSLNLVSFTSWPICITTYWVSCLTDRPRKLSMSKMLFLLRISTSYCSKIQYLGRCITYCQPPSQS